MSAGIKVNLYTGNIGDISTGERDEGQYDKPRELDACGGFTLGVRAKVFEQLDGIDERRRAVRDIDHRGAADRKRESQLGNLATRRHRRDCQRTDELW